MSDYICKHCKLTYHLYEDLRGGICFDCLYKFYRAVTEQKSIWAKIRKHRAIKSRP